MLIEGVPILLVVAGAVPHGVRVLALDQRPRLRGILHQLDDLRNAGIHWAHNVGGWCLRASPFVVDRAAGISRSDVACRISELDKSKILQTVAAYYYALLLNNACFASAHRVIFYSRHFNSRIQIQTP